MTLDTKLNQERAIEQLLKVIPIAEQAYRKAHRYIDLAAEIAGFKVELYGYLTMPKDTTNGVVTDVYLSHGQIVSSTKCQVDPRGEYDTHTAIKSAGNVAVGWWHSHKGLRLHSHSDEDDYNFRRVMQFMFGNDKRTVVTEENFVGSRLTLETQDNTVKISEPNGTITLELLLPESEGQFSLPSSLKGLRLTRALTFGCAYSLILNDDYNRPYCEVAVRDPLSGYIKISKEATLSFVETSNEQLDDRLLKEHISSRVRFNRPSRIYIPKSRTDFTRPVETKKTKTEVCLTGLPQPLVKVYSLIVGLDLENYYGKSAASDLLIKLVAEDYVILLPYTSYGEKHGQISADAVNNISDLMEKVRAWARKQLDYWLDIEGVTSQKIGQLELRTSKSSRGAQKKTRKALKMMDDKHEQNKRTISNLETILSGKNAGS